MPSFSKLLSFAVPLVAVAAAPLGARQVTPTDLLVFQFANVLEKLERDFYEKAIAKFTPEDFATAGYESTEVAAEQLGQILRDETAHQTALESALASFGQQPLPGCTFALDSVLTDVTTTMTVARLVEVTGVGAYLGAAALLSDPRLLTSAASILTIEARHGTMLNALNGGPTVPQAFDIPLAPEQVLAIAGGFIQGCDLGVKANPSLTITPEGGKVGPDTLLTFQSPGIDAAAGQPLFCQMVVGGATMSVSLPIENCRVPSGIIGPVAIFITNDEQPLLASDIVDQSKFNVVAGPNFVFVDFGTPQQKISRLILTPQSPLNKDLAGTPPSNENTVNTITPPEASSSIAAAGAQSTPAPAAGGAGASPAVNTVFQGDILVKMPPVGGEEAPAPTDALGSAGLPLPSVPVGSDGLPLPTGGPVDPALDPAAGGAAGAPIVPIAGDAAASGIALPADPLATGAPAGGDISISIGRRHRFMRRMD